MRNFLYHVFFEDEDIGGFFIGSYNQKEEADSIWPHVWDLFANDGTDKTDMILEKTRIWKHYKIYSDTQFSTFTTKGIVTSSGFASALVFKSDDKNFVEKYIKYRGTIQPGLFPKEPYEDCIMYKHKEKRSIALRKDFRRGRKIQEPNNIIVINGFGEGMQNYQAEKYGLATFLWKKIEVTQEFFDKLETTDTISIKISNENIRNEIIDFDLYFAYDINLKARVFDEKENILYFDLENIPC